MFARMLAFAVRFFTWWEEFAAKRPWGFAFTAIPLWFLLLAFAFRPAYETNDDAAMNMFAAGQGLARAPDEHLVFTHPVIGLMLRELYKQWPAVPWYGSYLLATQMLAHTILTGLLLKTGYSRGKLAVIVIWLGTVGIHFLTHLQFTTTAFLAGLAGVMVLWQQLAFLLERRAAALTSTQSNPQPAALTRKERRLIGLQLLLGMTLFAWGVMIRWYLLDLWLVLAVPVIGCWLLTHRARWPEWAITAGVIVLVALCGWGLRTWHVSYYESDPEWAGFYRYNELRAHYNDLLRVRYSAETAPSFAQAGWTYNDLNMINSWCYDDPRVFGEDKLTQILESRDWPSESVNTGGLKEQAKAIAGDHRIWTLAILLFGIMGLLAWRDQHAILVTLAAIAVAMALLLGLSFVRKAPPRRVYYPICCWVVVTAGWLLLQRRAAPAIRGGTTKLTTAAATNSAANTGSNSPRPAPQSKSGTGGVSPSAVAVASGGSPWPRWIAATAVTLWLGLALVPELVEQWQYSRLELDKSREFSEAMQALKFDPKTLYALWGAEVPIERFRPTDNLLWLADWRAIMFGWPQQTAFHRQMKAEFGINNLLVELPEHQEVRVISQPECFQFYARYAWEHDQRLVGYRPLGKFQTGLIAQFEPLPEDATARYNARQNTQSVPLNAARQPKYSTGR